MRQFRQDRRELLRFFRLLALLLLLAPNSCGKKSSDGDDNSQTPSNPTGGTDWTWTWVAGESETNGPGDYGSQNVAAPTNNPGARRQSGTWAQSGGTFYLFGGYGYEDKNVASSDVGYLNDLWRFDGHEWTWLKGSKTRNPHPVYGTMGTAEPDLVPGGRFGPATFSDTSGNLWLVGGEAIDNTGLIGPTNDLWKFDGQNWTWVSGLQAANVGGSAGTLGVPSANNLMGGRSGASAWIDAQGLIWVFGGLGHPGEVAVYLNDLWKFDGTHWTWMGGDATSWNEAGVYGTKGTGSPTNIPGGRTGMSLWQDTKGNVFLFGGHGYDRDGTIGKLNDLWKFDGTAWTWISGSDVVDGHGSYGDPGSANPANVPSARFHAVSWIDAEGAFWLFGGQGYDSAGTRGNLNDLWKFDGSAWTWVSGSKIADAPAVFGEKGSGSTSTVPSARWGASGWLDDAGALRLFGGTQSTTGAGDFANDMWKFSN